MLVAADWLLTGVHVAVVLGFMFLWIPRSTVRLHRWVVGLTAASWLVLGYFYGLGYCFLTDLHWHVKRSLGVRHLPGSFIKYAGDYVTGANLSPRVVDAVAGVVFLVGCGAAIWRYVEERRAKASSRAP
jgi:hypothetical protein